MSSRASERAFAPLAALILTVVTWQTRSLVATAGLDPSWRVGLHLAQTRDLSFGSDFTWTYGPLGFLAFPLAVTGGTLAAAVLFVLGTQLLLAWTLLRGTTRAYGPLFAVAITYVVLCLPLPPADFLPLTAFVLGVVALREQPAWFPVVGGLVAALALLTKTNTGAAAVAIVAVSAVAAGPRRVAQTVAVTLAGFVLGWLATGNALGELVGWLRLSAGLVLGYSSAMQYEQAGLARDFLLAGIAGAALAVLTLRRREPALWVVVAGFGFAFFKEGFVRHDPAHASAFFAAIAVAFVVVARHDLWRWAALAGFVFAAFAASLGGGTNFAPAASAAALGGHLHAIASGAKRHELVVESRVSERRSYEVPRRVLAALRGKTVHVDPFETAAINAYQLDWRPLPIAQSYSAYTTTLDDRNADVLASPAAPQAILRESLVTRLNQRDRSLEAPATFRAMLCNDVEVVASHRWQVLVHHPRCGAPRPLYEMTAPPGKPVAVPEVADDELLLVRIHFDDTVWDALRGILYKPHRPVVSLNSGPFTAIPAAVAEDGIVLHVPGAIDFDPAFGGAIDWRTIAAGGLAGNVRFSFETVAVRGTPRSPAGARPRRPLPRWTLLDDGVHAPDGKLLPVEEGGGFADWAWLQRGQLVLRGWAADEARALPATTVLVFADGRLVYAGAPNTVRSDVAAALGRPALKRSGYSILLPQAEVRHGKARAEVRIFSVVGRRALEVEYARSYGWRRW